MVLIRNQTLQGATHFCMRHLNRRRSSSADKNTAATASAGPNGVSPTTPPVQQSATKVEGDTSLAKVPVALPTAGESSSEAEQRPDLSIKTAGKDERRRPPRFRAVSSSPSPIR